MPIATEETSNATQVVTIGGLIVVTIGTICTAVLAYLSGRDRLRFDTEKTSLLATISQKESERAELQSRATETEVRHGREIKDIQNRAAESETRHEREIKELRDEIRDLRDRLYGGGGRPVEPPRGPNQGGRR